MLLDYCKSLKARVGSDTVSLYPYNDTFRLLGAGGCETSVEPGYKGGSAITIAPSKDQKIGFIAISINYGSSSYGCFLKVGRKEEKPYIYLQDNDDLWIPSADKLLQFTNQGQSLSIKIDDERYTTDQRAVGQNILPISTGNLLCRYAISEGEESKKLADEIKKAVIDRKEEISAKERIPELVNTIANLKSKNFNCRDVVKELKTVLENVRSVLDTVSFWDRTRPITKAKELISSVIPEKNSSN